MSASELDLLSRNAPDSIEDPVVSVTDVDKRFPQGVRALRQVSFAINAGRSTAVVGPSGSGKSTLLAILGLLDAPSSGSYRLCGQETTTSTDHERTLLRRAAIGFVFQSFHLIPHLTALENVEESFASPEQPATHGEDVRCMRWTPWDSHIARRVFRAR